MNNRYLYKARRYIKRSGLKGFMYYAEGIITFFQYMILITDSMSDIQNGLR